MKPPSPSVNTVTALCCSAMRSPRSVPDSGRPTECSARRSTAAAATAALEPQRRRIVVLASPARAARTLSVRPAYPSRASSSSAAVSTRSSVSGAGGLPRRGLVPAGRGGPVSVCIAFRYLRLHYSILPWRLTGADQAVSSRGFCDRGLQPGLGQAYSRSGFVGRPAPVALGPVLLGGTHRVREARSFLLRAPPHGAHGMARRFRRRLCVRQRRLCAAEGFQRARVDREGQRLQHPR